MQKKIRISEFEKELKKIDENVQVTKSITGYRRDYNIKFNSLDGYLCAFNLGTLDGLKLYYHNTYDKFKSDVVLNKAIELIPHLVPDDYKEPTIEEIFEEFKEEAEEKGFHTERRSSGDYDLSFDFGDRALCIASYEMFFKKIYCYQPGDGPIDKYLEGLKLFISYVEKVKALEKEKKYYLVSKWLDKKYEDGYLNYHEGAGNFTLSDKNYDELFKTQFTEKEIEEIKDEFDVSLEDFEWVEAE